MILDVVQLIVYFRTASAEAALKSVKSAEARRTAIALRLRRRRRSMLLRSRREGVVYGADGG